MAAYQTLFCHETRYAANAGVTYRSVFTKRSYVVLSFPLHPSSLSFLPAISVSRNPSLQSPSHYPHTAVASYRGGAPFHRGTLSRAHTPLIPLPLPPPSHLVAGRCERRNFRCPFVRHPVYPEPSSIYSDPIRWRRCRHRCGQVCLEIARDVKGGCETRAGRGEGWGRVESVGCRVQRGLFSKEKTLKRETWENDFFRAVLFFFGGDFNLVIIQRKRERELANCSKKAFRYACMQECFLQDNCLKIFNNLNSL